MADRDKARLEYIEGLRRQLENTDYNGTRAQLLVLIASAEGPSRGAEVWPPFQPWLSKLANEKEGDA